MLRRSVLKGPVDGNPLASTLLNADSLFGVYRRISLIRCYGISRIFLSSGRRAYRGKTYLPEAEGGGLVMGTRT
jgi:hypothetical protein